MYIRSETAPHAFSCASEAAFVECSSGCPRFWSIGASRRQLTRGVLYEAAMISLMGAGLGGIVSLWLSRRIVEQTIRTGSGMVFDFVSPFDAILVTATVCVAVSLLSALGPALGAARSSRRDPALD